MAWGGFAPASPLLTVKPDGDGTAVAPKAEEGAPLCERLAAKGYNTVGLAAATAAKEASPAEPPVEAEAPAQEPAPDAEFTVTMDNTLKEMQTFAAEHPELGLIA